MPKLSTKNGTACELLPGTGAAYIRVSTDDQDTERQYAAIRAFAARMTAVIAKPFWFEDEGWARDEAERRPAFQRLLKLAEAKKVQWIVVDALDRFGTKDAHQLVHYLYRLRECGCRLYDAQGKEWTGEDIATIITAVVEGEKSKGEQTAKSHRVLGGKVEKARAGEWQGGPIRLGFDVVCYDRETDQEQWRVVFEGKTKRIKINVDGRCERFDGKGNFPKFQPLTQVLRIGPSKEHTKIQAATSVFKRFATESISFTTLARDLNKLGWRNCYGGYFQSQQIESMLEDPIYIGYYTYNRRSSGKFNRFAEGQVVPELNYDKVQSKNKRANWVQSKRLFSPLVERKTWDAVQKKLIRAKRGYTPRSERAYLAGLVVCGNCGGRMVSGAARKPTKYPRKDGSTGEKIEYFCGTYFKAVRDGRRRECKCQRNGVFQDVLEQYVERYLQETGKRLEVFNQPFKVGELTSELQKEELQHWRAFTEGIKKLTGYLAEHHPEEYARVLATCETESYASDEVVHALVATYRNNHDPERLIAERERLEKQHDVLLKKALNLHPSAKRAIEKVNAELSCIEAKMDDLEQQAMDLGDVVSSHYNESQDLCLAIADARLAMQAHNGEQALRRKAEALRAVIQRIECTFETTGKKGSGWGKKHSRLAKITIYPVAGESAEFAKGTLLYSSAHSRMKRTRVGEMR